MSIICELFGHKPTSYRKGAGANYGELHEFYTDEVGRIHAKVWGKCARCGEVVHLAYVHVRIPPKLFTRELKHE